MRYRVHLTPAADSDMDEAALYIARRNLSAALRFYDAIEETLDVIRANPGRWPILELDHPRLTDVRKCTVIRFRQYLIFYRVEGQIILIIRLLHGARDLPTVLGSEG